jgi:hypothetical protein
MFECLVCSDRTGRLSYATVHRGDYIPLCSRRCRATFLADPEQFLPHLEDLELCA